MSFSMRSTADIENPEYFRDRARRLLASAGFTSQFELVPLRGGANNRVFKAECVGGAALLKAYYHDPRDGRDRLGAEFAFSRFAWNMGVRCVPRPIGHDTENHLGLYEFIEGRTVRPEEIDKLTIGQACKFYRNLNARRLHVDAAALPAASEACLSLNEHLQCVRQRLDRLKDINYAASALDLRAREIIKGALSDRWQRIVHNFTQHVGKSGLNADERLGDEELRLSPSDFGFHNSLATENGRLRFFDFEYAGWDDPAKLVCDFFCQRKVPVAESYFDGFAAAVVADLPRPEMMMTRIALLMPIFRFKWCCIMLNEFLPVEAKRRRFAAPTEDLEVSKRQQLAKVCAALEEFSN